MRSPFSLDVSRVSSRRSGGPADATDGGPVSSSRLSAADTTAASHAAAAALHGVPATIVMPYDAPASKLAATRGYGGEVVGYDRYDGDPAAIAASTAA